MKKELQRGMQALGFSLVRVSGGHLIYRRVTQTFPISIHSDPRGRGGLNLMQSLRRLGLRNEDVRRAFGLRVD